MTHPLERFNRTELLMIAENCELPGLIPGGSSKGYSRETLIHMLETMSPAPPEPLLEIRKRMEDYLRRKWRNFRSQKPREQCPNCMHGIAQEKGGFLRSSDMQAADCYLKNKKRIDHD